MGIFAMPVAFKAAGLRFGLIATICSGIICTHTSNILVLVSQDICYKYKHLALGYSETVHYVFAYGPEHFNAIDKWCWYVFIIINGRNLTTFTFSFLQSSRRLWIICQTLWCCNRLYRIHIDNN